jgi:hypothetical protein
MTKESAIIAAKTFRKEADDLLQRMKEHTRILCETRQDLGGGILPFDDRFQDINETIAQHILSTRDLESCIMRQGMALKYIGTPNPYPNSKDPSNTVVEPTADNLKM